MNTVYMKKAGDTENSLKLIDGRRNCVAAGKLFYVDGCLMVALTERTANSCLRLWTRDFLQGNLV